MNAQTVWAPFSTLNDSALSPHARLVWLLLAAHPAGSPPPTNMHLSELSGLCREAIGRLRRRLAQSPPQPCYARPQQLCAAMPGELLAARDLSVGARLLYGQIQAIPNYINQKGSSTYAALSDLTGSSSEALRRAAAELAARGWLTLAQASRKSRITFTLRNPVAKQAWARSSAIRRKVKSAQHRGERILKEFLNAMVALDKYEDNATPDFLVNPYTGELMELDRYYPAAQVAFEFQGDQHFSVTDLAAEEATVKQVGRDAMKAFLCKVRGIELVTIHPEELTLRAIARKIPLSLPRRDLNGSEPLLATLEEQAAEYRERTADERARKGRTSR